MQYVAKFINVIGGYYGEIGINSANSTGATDIIVVEQPDGTLKCTPFHARFGKLNILRPKEVIVDLYLNNEFIKEINMRVEPTGQAYFEIETEDPNLAQIRTDHPSNDLNNYIKDDQGKFLEPSVSITRSSGLKSSSDKLSKNLDGRTDTKQTDNDIIDQGYRSCDEFVNVSPKLSQLLDSQDEMKLSLCGGFESLKTMDSKSSDHFYSKIISFNEFSKNPYDIINNPNLVILYNNEFMNWKTFSVQIIARHAYHRRISEKSKCENLYSQNRVKKEYGKWVELNESRGCEESKFSNKPIANLNVNEDMGLIYNSRLRTLSGDILFPDNTETKDSSNTDLENINSKSNNGLLSANNISSRSVDDSAIHFTLHGIKKTNVLPHDKLKYFKLNEGVNELFYVITGRYRGTIKVGCKVYLWHWSDRIVVSDIDGTITKSDVWGQLAPWLGLDWTQSGIVKLYNSIQKNFFRFVYLSARAIGQADQTRDYLQNVNQQDMCLPDGPLLLSPNSLIIAFKKEVIDKTPEEFKINCLNELKSIFPVKENFQSLYAGFGNKPSDEVTYKTVGIPESKIFTVNKKGVLQNKALVTSLSDTIDTYDTLTQLVNQYFPSKYTELPYSSEYSSFSFWRSDIPTIPKENLS